MLPHFISVFPIWGCLGGVLAYLLVLDNSIRVLSANCQGLQNQQKRVDVLHCVKEMNSNIICLQDTHWTKAGISSIKAIWGNVLYSKGQMRAVLRF